MKSSELVARLRAQAQVYDARVTVRSKVLVDDDRADALEYGLNRWWNDQATTFREAADRIEELEKQRITLCMRCSGCNAVLALVWLGANEFFQLGGPDGILHCGTTAHYIGWAWDIDTSSPAQAPLVVEPTPLSGSQPGMADDTAASPLPLENP
jgi:hypothetical protein